jgi:hypothetical protein
VELEEPWRNGGSGRCENHADSVSVCNCECAIHPIEYEFPGRGLKQRPGKLAHANSVDAKVAHLAEIDFPFFGGPPLWVVCRAEEITLPTAVADRRGIILRRCLEPDSSGGMPEDEIQPCEANEFVKYSSLQFTPPFRDRASMLGIDAAPG